MGLISFVGAGPGAPDLLTLRGLDRLRRAEIVIWASSLIPEEMLDHTGPGAQLLDSAPMTLEDVVGVYERNPEARIVRLHSGDPSIYGAVAEQIEWCVAAGRTFEIVPGVTSVSAAAAVLGRELTIPQVAQSLVVTRVARRTSSSMPEHESLAAYAAIGGTLAILLSGAQPELVQEELTAPGSRFGPETPAAVVIRATWPDEQVIWTTVAELAATIRASKATRTLTVVVGGALTAGAARSHLYSPEFSHRFRSRSERGSTEGKPKTRPRRSVR